MIQMSSVSIQTRDSVMDLRKCWHDTKTLSLTFDLQVLHLFIPVTYIFYTAFLKFNQMVLSVPFSIFSPYCRANIFCSYHWDGHYNCRAKWWPVPCFGDNCWWAGNSPLFQIFCGPKWNFVFCVVQICIIFIFLDHKFVKQSEVIWLLYPLFLSSQAKTCVLHC